MKTQNTKQPANWPSEETIKKWKEKFQIDEIHVFEVVHPKENTKHYLFLRTPTLVDSHRAIESENVKTGTYAPSLFNNCKLQCDPEIENNEAMLRFVYAQIGKTIKIADGELKKI